MPATQPQNLLTDADFTDAAHAILCGPWFDPASMIAELADLVAATGRVHPGSVVETTAEDLVAAIVARRAHTPAGV